MKTGVWEREKGVSYLCYLVFEMRKCAVQSKAKLQHKTKVDFVIPMTYFPTFFFYLLAFQLFS